MHYYYISSRPKSGLHRKKSKLNEVYVYREVQIVIAGK